MITLQKSWDEFKDIFDNGNYYFDEDLDGDDYILSLQRNAMVGVVCRIAHNDTTAITDYETNYQACAGTKTYLRKGWSGQLTSGTDYVDIELSDTSDTNIESYLYDGHVQFYGGAAIGDKYEITIEHPVAGTVGVLLQNNYVELINQPLSLKPPQYDYTSSKKKIPAGLKIRVKYLETITAPIDYIIHAEYEF